jgi:hypothetical protein
MLLYIFMTIAFATNYYWKIYYVVLEKVWRMVDLKIPYFGHSSHSEDLNVLCLQCNTHESCYNLSRIYKI